MYIFLPYLESVIEFERDHLTGVVLELVRSRSLLPSHFMLHQVVRVVERLRGNEMNGVLGHNSAL